MSTTSARLLRLLSLLQSAPDRTGPRLAERLGVSTRTVRNDVERLRDLGYPVHATPGPAGGYRLGAGTSLPPLLLDDEEAVAVVVGLRTAAGGTVTGIEETSLRALAKLEQVLPSRLRHRVDALHTVVVALRGDAATVDPGVLVTLAGACRDRESLRFDYTGHDGAVTRRLAEPYRLVHLDRRWYLVAWDVERRDWRTFRADRIAPRTPGGPRFAPREPPDGDVAAYVLRGVGAAPWRYRARVRLHAPAEAVAGRLPPPVVVEAVDEHTCVIEAGADDPRTFMLYLGMLDVDFDVVDSPELSAHLGALIRRYGRARGDRP
ncbi:helix-turn-helix transcriptional regulator [Streptosporangium longisporum]|uniref:YafY family protein n=1 Tax=Streptosporangium longisporum TaxID=46187 RepID=A0ABN3XUM3_9ACTN